jgi:DNA-binding transcriptional LysR family regulator
MERLKALEIFKAVADHGSFTKAADAAHVGVPSVSRAVQDLETLLGVQLFNRTTRKVTLTPVGHTVLEHAAGVLDCYEDLARVSNDIALDVSGDLRLEVPALFGMSRLAPILANFTREHPKVRVDTRLVDHQGETLGDLADLSIVVGRAAPASCVARQLAATRFGMYASPAFLSGAGMPRHPDDVRPEHCMTMIAGSHDATLALTHAVTGERSALRARSAFRTNCPSALISATLDSLGMAVLPESIARLSESRGELVRVLNDWRAPSLDTLLVYRTRRNLPLRVRKLIDCLVASFGDDEAGSLSPLRMPPNVPAVAHIKAHAHGARWAA